MVTQATRLSDFITALGTDWKNIWSNTGNKSALNTTDKSSLVAAINEVNNKPSGTGGAVIDDTNAGTSQTTTYSAKKIKDADDLKAPIASPTFTGTVGGITKSMVGLGSVDNTSDSAKPVSTAQAAAILALIDDAAVSTTTNKTASINKINQLIATAVAGLVNSASTTLDTLGEIATALGNDANFATTITTALGKRVSVLSAQSFTTGEKAQARANIDAYGSVELGNPDTDLVALWNTAKS